MRSCEHVPALQIAMHTIAPIISARRLYAEPFPADEQEAPHVAIRTPIVMPESGHEDEPTSPVMRDDTTREQEPEHEDQHRAEQRHVERRHEPDERDDRERADERAPASACRGRCAACRRRRLAPPPNSDARGRAKRRTDRRQRAGEREEAARGDGAGADVLHVVVPDVARRTCRG